MKAWTNGPVKQLSSKCLSFCTFRTVNAKLAIDWGRWYDIAHENRKCTIICNCNEIGDGFQYLFHSTDITIKEILTTFICITLYSFTKPNVSKLKQIFKTNKNSVD